MESNRLIELFKCGYCGNLLDSQSEILIEHGCFKKIYIEDQHDLVEDAHKVLTIVLKGETQTVVGGESIGETMEEKLIKLVQDRPPLYNPKLPVVQRTLAKKNALWLEIFNLFGGNISIEDIQKKWKYLRDRYNRAKKRVTEYRPSGSQASPFPDPGFNYYELMRFLDDGISHQESVSSIAVSNVAARQTFSAPSSSCSSVGTPLPLFSPPPLSSSCSSRAASPEAFFPSLLDPSTPSTSKIRPAPEPSPSLASDKSKSLKRKKEEPKNVIEHQIASMLSDGNKSTDGVDGFLIRLGESLRKIPYRERCKLEMEIMAQVYETEVRLDIN